MKKLKSTDQQPPDARITVIRGDEIFCYFDDDPEVIDAVAQRVREQEQHARTQRKHEREQDIKLIKITTASDKIFDGNEISQQRMQRAINVLGDGEIIEWTLADNTRANVARLELKEALRLAFLKQSEIHNEK